MPNALCSFGSNLYHQANPDPRTSKQLDRPRLVTLDSSWKSAEILVTTDCQTIVRGVGVQDEDIGIQIWGYCPARDRIANCSGTRDALPDGLRPTEVKRWLGSEEALGYLDSAGFLHRIDERYLTQGNMPRHSPTGQSYRDATVNGKGEVLVILSSRISGAPLQQLDQTTESDRVNFSLELWPSLESLVRRSSSDDHQPYTTFTIADLDPALTEIEITSGAAHFLILIHNHVSTDGQRYHSKVYAFGDNRFGQLGLGSHSTRVDAPQLIQELEGVKSIECGSFHSLALCHDGTLYIFGQNRHGQCGAGEAAGQLMVPTLVDIGGGGESGEVLDVLQARCGSEHTVVLTSEGIWVAGSNSLGQLGLQEEKSMRAFEMNLAIGKLMGVDTHPKRWKVLCGRWHTFVWN